MSEETARKLTLVEDFYAGLLEIQQFADAHGGKGRQVVNELMEFAYSTIAPQPRAFPVYTVSQHPEREYRRAVFRKKYVLIYRITDAELTFLVVHSTRQNPPTLPA